MKSQCCFTIISRIKAFKTPSGFAQIAIWLSTMIFTRTTHPRNLKSTHQHPMNFTVRKLLIRNDPITRAVRAVIITEKRYRVEHVTHNISTAAAATANEPWKWSDIDQ
ncbi:hypothetical protein TSUD_11460 [Trifolium subterraneum]|nr:hypothetical protein TSUD_11460 [Trifolium subterraneum]